MTEQEIRTEIRQRLKDGRLPRRLDVRFPRAGQAGDLGSIVIGGDLCSACDGTNPHHTYTGPSGENVSFHEKCEEIWNEERTKLTPN